MSNFDYAGLLTEAILLGNVAMRVGKKIEWDGPNLKATNCPEADQYVSRNTAKAGRCKRQDGMSRMAPFPFEPIRKVSGQRQISKNSVVFECDRVLGWILIAKIIRELNDPSSKGLRPGC